MKRTWLILTLGVALGAVAFGLIYRHTAGSHDMPGPARTELAWLKTDFHLSDAEFTAVCQLHESYVPKCAEMCRRIQAKNAEIGRLVTQGTAMTPDLERALAEAGQWRLECQKAMLEHFYSVSRAMPPEDGKRYLSKMFEATSVRGQTMRHE